MDDHQPHDPHELLRWELAQRQESGFTLGDLAEAGRRAADGDDAAVARGLLDELGTTTRDESWAYDEPEDLSGILATLPDAPVTSIGEAELRDRTLGGWLGRCAGCNLGKPVENGDQPDGN